MKTYFDFLTEETRNNNPELRIFVIQGSPRNKESCSGEDSKTNFLLKNAIKSLPKNIAVDLLDLKVNNDLPQVRPCKGCISTSNGFHCHYPCSCYAKGDGTNDLMYEEDVYKRMEKSDGIVVFTPVHWNSVTTQVKALFDRLVCINLTLTSKDAKKILGDDIKNPKATAKLEKSGEHKDLIKNHYEGKVAAFFVHGDNGANDYKSRKIPLSMVGHSDQISPREAIEPIIQQCRYSGIFVPDNCIESVICGYGKPYSQNNLDFKKSDMLKKSIKLFENLIKEIKKIKK